MNRIAVNIVSHNSERHIQSCLESLARQVFSDFTVAVWDNASKDATRNILNSYRGLLGYVHFSEKNTGFCEAHNRLIDATNSDYVLVLNPDVILDPGFLRRMLEAMDGDTRAGSATGKLLRQPPRSPGRPAECDTTLDSTGMYITPTQRHFDRGSNEVDSCRYETPEYVFGASGAAAFYRRAMLEDVRFKSEYFDETFFAYREDADLAWRALWMGWQCLYVPDAIAYHARRVLPENRSTLPDIINMHSFKNRFLLRVKNMDAGTFLRFLVPIILRDLAALAYVLVRERSSLEGIPRFIRSLPHAWAWRKVTRSKRRATAREIRSWFSYTPISKPVMKSPR